MARGDRKKGGALDAATDVAPPIPGEEIEGEGPPAQGPLEPEGTGEADGMPGLGELHDEPDVDLPPDPPGDASDEEAALASFAVQQTPGLQATGTVPLPRGAASPTQSSQEPEDLALLEVLHGEINSRYGLKTRGETFRAPRKDVGWLVGTGNIKLVER